MLRRGIVVSITKHSDVWITDSTTGLTAGLIVAKGISYCRWTLKQPASLATLTTELPWTLANMLSLSKAAIMRTL